MSDKLSKGWIDCDLGSILYVRNGYAFKSKIYSREGTPLIRISEIKNGGISIDNAVRIPARNNHSDTRRPSMALVSA